MAPSGGKSTKADREELDELVRLYEDRDPTDLVWFHSLGRLLDRLERRDVVKGSIRTAAERLPGGLSLQARVNELTSARRFARDYPRLGDVRALVSRARRQDLRFGVTHVTYLASISNGEMRRLFLERCLLERWSGTRLRAEIRRSRGDPKSTGRPIRAPATRIEGLHGLLERSAAWLQRFEMLRPVIGEPDRSEKPQDVEKLLRDAQRLLRQMGTAIEDAIPKLRAAERQAKKAAQNGR